MLAVIAYCQRDLPLARDLLAWITELDPALNHDLLLVAARGIAPEDRIADVSAFRVTTSIHQVTPEERPWPRAANAMFRTACEWIKTHHHQPWLWLEPDMVPMCSGWLDKLLAEYVRCGKPFMGAIYDHPFRH